MLKKENNRSERPVKHPLLVAVMALVAVAFAFVLNSQPTSSISYALYLFSVLIHEICHSVVTLLTGGHVLGFVVNAGSGGFAQISGGNAWFSLPAGYVGCAFFGSIMLFICNRFRWADLQSCVVGAFLIFFTLIFGRPEENGSLTAHFVAGGFGAILFLIGFWGPLWLNMLAIDVISTLTALQGLMGALQLYHFSQQTHHNDAVMFSQQFQSGLTGNQIALGWAAISVVLFLIAFYLGVVKTVFHGGKLKWKYFSRDKKMFYEA